MSHNRKTANQPTKGPSNKSSRTGHDYAGMPSLRDNQFHPLQIRRSSTPLLPPVSLFQGERLRPILPASSSWQPSNHLEHGSTSSSNPSMKRDFSTAFEGLDSSTRQSVGRAMDPANGFIPNIPREARPSASLTSAALQPSSTNLEQRRHTVSSSASEDPSRNLRPRRTSSTSSNPMLMPDFSSRFEGLPSSFRQSVERAMDPTTGLFPNIPMDARRAFLMQQSRDLKFQCRRVALSAEWAYDAIVDSETRAKKAEEQVNNLQCQLRACEEEHQSKERAVHILYHQLCACQASVQEERRSKEQSEHLRRQSDHERQASVERVKELEGKLAAFEQELEQGRAEMESMLKVHTGLEADVGELREHPVGDREMEQRHARIEYFAQVVTGMEATVDKPQGHSSGDRTWVTAAAGECGMGYLAQVVTGLETTIDKPQDHSCRDWPWEPAAAFERERELEQVLEGVEPSVTVTTGLEANEEPHENLLDDLISEPAAMEREQEQGLGGIQPC